LCERTPEQGIAHHQGNEVRVYENDRIQKPRIRISRKMLDLCLQECEPPADVWEMGCGTADISGPFADKHSVIGVECFADAATKARERFPEGQFVVGAVEEQKERPCDVIVLCEVLEHIEDPKALVARWLPQAEWSVISHPLDEAAGSTLSGGDHCWSFSEEDFKEWFRIGGHEHVDSVTLEQCKYRVMIGRGRRTPAAT
jgi:hypothetical protein